VQRYGQTGSMECSGHCGRAIADDADIAWDASAQLGQERRRDRGVGQVGNMESPGRQAVRRFGGTDDYEYIHPPDGNSFPPLPELPEVEFYRLLAEQALDRSIKSVDAPDAWYLKRGATARSVRAALRGRAFTGTRRIGKLLLLDVSDGAPTLGLHFGMSGRLLVDGTAAVDDLKYSSNREMAAWDRFRVRFDDGGDLRVRDPRRLGAVELDPDESRLGPDAFLLSAGELARILGTSASPVKARLMDQARLAGVGNLIADEVLWRAGIDPRRPASQFDSTEVKRLHRHLRKTIADFLKRGGSHTGELLPHRVTGGHCPKDGTPLSRATVGGRTTYWCPTHQV
jgi:formamidopyrimidine-DNA glycosylase